MTHAVSIADSAAGVVRRIFWNSHQSAAISVLEAIASRYNFQAVAERAATSPTVFPRGNRRRLLLIVGGARSSNVPR